MAILRTEHINSSGLRIEEIPAEQVPAAVEEAEARRWPFVNGPAVRKKAAKAKEFVPFNLVIAVPTEEEAKFLSAMLNEIYKENKGLGGFVSRDQSRAMALIKSLQSVVVSKLTF